MTNASINLTELRGPARASETIHRLHLVALYDVLFALEILLTLTGMCFISAALVYRVKSKIHVNLQYIFANAELHFIVLAPSRFVSMALIICCDSADPSETVIQVYSVAAIIRQYYMVVAALTLPAAALERFFSTIYVSDYETKRRTYLSVVTIGLTNSVSITFSIGLSARVLPLALPLVVVGTTNILGLLLFVWSSKRNTAYYYSCLMARPRFSRWTYSLSERFQTIENIRVAKLLKTLYVTAWIAQAICFCIILVPVLSRNEVLDRIMWQVFDMSIIIFANVVGGVNLYQSQFFRTDWRRMHAFVKKRRRSAISAEVDAGPARNVFGDVLIPRPEDQTRLYFVQLEHLWSGGAAVGRK